MSTASTSKWVVRIAAKPLVRPLSGPCEFDTVRQPARLASRGNEHFFGTKIAENPELSSPERLVSKNDCRLIAAHAARFTTSQQHCSERYHLPLVILSEGLQKQNEVEESLTFSPREKHH
jgi:hypothetical protein